MRKRGVMDGMGYRLTWDRDGADWPHRQASRFVTVAGMRWHVQVMGQGPAVLLLHGTGASTHSWRGLAPLLARRFTVVIPDLPGHGFTERPFFFRLTLPNVARAMDGLLRALGIEPVLAVGHSAGAAILIQMSLDGTLAPRAIVSLNGALRPFRGTAGHVFPSLAKVLFLNPVTPRLFAWSANDRERVERLLHGTGSPIDAEGVDLYARLFRCPSHVAGALYMMANWDLHTLGRELPRLKTPLVLVAADRDRTVTPDVAEEVHRMVPGSRVVILPGLGHLAHEEKPEVVADLVERLAVEADVQAAA